MKCAKCGKELSLSNVDNIRITEDNEMICEDCAIKYYRKCNSCGRYISRCTEATHCKICERVYYDSCISAYHSKPEPLFNNKNGIKKDCGIRHFGLEIEYSNVNPTALWLSMVDIYKDRLIYNKRDSSLNNGVEIVTNPCDYYSIKELLKRMEPTLLEVEKCKKYKTNAGIHIHVNRKSISPIDIYKLSYLFNAKKCGSDITKRKLLYLCGRIRGVDCGYDDHYYCIEGSEDIRCGSDRYVAINTTNKNTIEFRLFKTSADINVILSYIDFVNSALDFVHHNGFKDMSIDNFINYLYNNSNNKLIVNKINNLKRKGLLSEHKELSFKLDTTIDGIDFNDYYRLLCLITNSKYRALKYRINHFKDFKNYYSEIGENNMNLDITKRVIKELSDSYKEIIREKADLLCV